MEGTLMAFIFGERLVEFVIRVGVDDIQKDPAFLDKLFESDPLLNVGADVSPEGGPETHEQLIMDEFQAKLAQVPPRPSEVLLPADQRFRNIMQTLPDMKSYIASMNVKIAHGYPREEKDLPGIFINLGVEDEQQYLGDLKQRIEDSTNAKSYEVYGVDQSTSYAVAIVSTNYDETILLHFLCKYALIRYRRVLEVYGLRQMQMHWGDIEPAEALLQGGITAYQRVGMLNCHKTEDFPVEITGFNKAIYGQDVAPDKEVIPGVYELGPGEGL
jgi:hypothetical protein